ncbi:MAG: trimeric autotransporter adhesin, partial [Thermoproteota archaeon]|nr:trimeric autotransporter adhesin [Thermoproteota archaeon]
ADGLILANGQNMWLVQFLDSDDLVIASFGTRADSFGTRWAIQYGSGETISIASYSIPTPAVNTWYLLGAHYIVASTGKTIVLTVNGAEVASLSLNTTGNNNIASVRFGLDYYVGSSTATVYLDNVIIDGIEVQKAQYILNVQVNGSGATNVITGNSYDDGISLPVKALPDSGWALSYWVLDGKNMGSVNPLIVTMDGEHDLIAVFKEVPQPSIWNLLTSSTFLSGLLVVILTVVFYLAFMKKSPIGLASQ